MHFWRRWSRKVWLDSTILRSFFSLSWAYIWRKYSKLCLFSLNASTDSLQLSLLQYLSAFSARRDIKWTQANFSPLATRWGYWLSPIFSAKVRISGCIWYIYGLGRSRSDLVLRERRMESGRIPGIEHAFITASAASELNGPGNTDKRTKASFCSAWVRRSNEVLIASSTDVSSSFRTDKGCSSRCFISLSSV